MLVYFLGSGVGVYIYIYVCVYIYLCVWTYKSMYIWKCQIAISQRCRVSRLAVVHVSWGRVRCPLEEALFVLSAE